MFLPPSCPPPGFGDPRTWDPTRQPFHPLFIKSLERYAALRFMDWQATNEDEFPAAGWAGRARPGMDTQVGGLVGCWAGGLVGEMGIS